MNYLKYKLAQFRPVMLRMSNQTLQLNKLQFGYRMSWRRICKLTPQKIAKGRSYLRFNQDLFPNVLHQDSDLARWKNMSSGETLNTNKLNDSSNSESVEKKMILPPFDYIGSVPGKESGRKLIKAFNYWLNVPSDTCNEIGDIVQMVHDATLLIDDIEDDSKLRRGVPAAHTIFGVDCTLNTVIYIFFDALGRVTKLGNSRGAEVFSEVFHKLQRGTGMEMYWKNNLICPTEEEYKEMAEGKTCVITWLVVRLMQLFSDNKNDFTKLMEIIGVYYQIRNDYENLQFKEYTGKKSYCEDLTEGKFSFPVIHAIRSNEKDPRIMNIIKLRTEDLAIKKYALAVLEEMGSLEYTRNVLKELDEQAREEINRLGYNKQMISFMDAIKLP